MPRPSFTHRQKKIQSCAICKTGPKKYTCPRDQVFYCSVACFVVHKEQADCPGTKLYASQPLEPPPPLAENRPGVSEDEKLEEPKPIRPLADLRWPVLDDKQSAVFFDPLRRDEVKPLRKFEWEAIATSEPLRALLTSGPPYLKGLLQKIASSSDRDERHRLIQGLLGLQLAQPGRERGQMRQTTSLVSDEEERLFRPFAETIKEVLDAVRLQR